MFTGIVGGTGQVCSIFEEGSHHRIRIDAGPLADGVKAGASVSINGACLTVVDVQDGILDFDVISATWNLTNLPNCKIGSTVNIERSARLGDEIGGHALSGHISGTAVVLLQGERVPDRMLRCTVPSPLVRYLMPKGFIALNGVSLTVADLDRSASEIAVNLIPETLRRTNLADACAGTLLNLELDAMTQAIVETTEAALREAGLAIAVN